MLFILLFLVTLACAGFIVLRLTGNMAIAVVAGIALGFVGVNPVVCGITVVLAIILACTGS